MFRQRRPISIEGAQAKAISALVWSTCSERVPRTRSGFSCGSASDSQACNRSNMSRNMLSGEVPCSAGEGMASSGGGVVGACPAEEEGSSSALVSVASTHCGFDVVLLGIWRGIYSKSFLAWTCAATDSTIR